ncbi:putative lipase 1 [[Candida] railenensis]|uniref:Lipase 1 n=1 Tax=[Candida] railenensis TaxID=45579 RepID=A0A9P0W116_9ASCO|nr:putative lipase 1 [[Candida] railenensis]
MRFIPLFLLLALFTTVFAAPAADPSPVLKPSEDPFYVPPDGFESEEVGTVLRLRKSPHPLRSVYFELNVKDSWQVLVRSSTAEGNATAVVTTLIEPYNANSSRLVSYQIAQDSAKADCAASYAFQYGADVGVNLVAEAEMFLIQIALIQGFWVSAPDYEGPQASFTAGRMSGKAVLDTIKGVISSANETGLAAEPDVILWGYSGGSLASGWAAAMQPWYAPDLAPRLKGAALGGFVTNITETVVAVDGSLYAGMITAGFTGLSNEYPSLKKYITEYIPEDRLSQFNLAGDQCLLLACGYYMYTQIFRGEDKYTGGYDILHEPEVWDTLMNTTLGVGKDDLPQIPIFIYHGEKDGIVPFVNTERIYDVWCEWGIGSLEVSSSQTTKHVTEAIFGSTAAAAWIDKMFNGGAAVQGCKSTSRYNNLLYPGVLPEVVDLVESAVKSIFGFEIGPTSPIQRRETIDLDAIVERKLEERFSNKRSIRW